MPRIDRTAWQTWVAVGGLLGAALPLVLFLSVRELLVALIATAIGAGVAYGLWGASFREQQ